MAEPLDIGTLAGRIELEDRLTNVLSSVETAIAKFDAKAEESAGSVTKMASAVALGQGALDLFKGAANAVVGSIEDVIKAGVGIADIEDAFAYMTKSAGLLGDEITSKVVTAMHGTIDDSDIMRRVNENLTVGLKMTADQMAKLAEGAFALGKATGVDAAGAFDRLNQAMVTGRTRGIMNLVGKIDSTEAEKKYAASLGVTTDQLTTEGKLEAIRTEILERASKATERVGETTIRMSDKIKAAEVRWADFQEQLGKTIMDSPVIIAGFDSINDAVNLAFGSTNQTAAAKIVSIINDMAIGLTYVADGGVLLAGVLGEVWYTGKEGIDYLMLGLYDTEVGLKQIAIAAYEVGNAMGWPGAKEALADMKEQLALTVKEQVAWADQLDKDEKAQAAFEAGLGKVMNTVSDVRAAMIKARDTQVAHTEAKNAGTAAEEVYTAAHRKGIVYTDTAAAAAESHAKALTDEAVKAAAAAMANDGVSDSVKKQVVAIQSSVEALDNQSKSQEKNALFTERSAEKQKIYDETLKEMTAAGGKAIEFGEGWRLQLEKLDPVMVKQIQHWLDAGIALDKLAVFYGQNSVAMEAIKKGYEEQVKNAKEGTALLAKVDATYFEKKAEMYGTDLEQAIAKINKEYAKYEEDARKKHNTSEEFYRDLAAMRDRDLADVEDNLIAQDQLSLSYHEAELRRAEERYSMMLYAGNEYQRVAIEEQRERVDGLRMEVNAWAQIGVEAARVKDNIVAGTEAVDQMTAQVQVLAGQMSSLYESTVASTQAANQSTFGGSWAVTKDTFRASMEAAHIGVSMDTAEAMAMMGYSYGEIIGYRAIEEKLQFTVGAANKAKAIEKLINSGWQPPPQGPRIPGFIKGGVGDFGDGTLVMLHGKEAIVPLGESGGGGVGGSSIVVHNYVNGTAADVARQISDEIMRKLQSVRQFSYGS
jgi:hypothetical protein